MQLLLGKPVYMDDITPSDALSVKVLRSPHAHALIEDIKTEIALKVPGIVGIYTYKMCRRSVLPWQGRPILSPRLMIGFFWIRESGLWETQLQL